MLHLFASWREVLAGCRGRVLSPEAEELVELVLGVQRSLVGGQVVTKTQSLHAYRP